MNTSPSRQPTAPKTIRFDDSMLYVVLQNGLEISASLERFPRLLRGSSEQRMQWRTIGGGDGIHWPLLDEDISVASLLKQNKPELVGAKELDDVIRLVGEMYATSRRLSQMTNGRKFTLDGLFVSTTGQVVAEYIYGLTPEIDQRFHDARTKDGVTVQIMLTGETGKRFDVRWTDASKASHADLMLCLKIGEDGFEEVYNGAFPRDLLLSRTVQKNGQVHLSVASLREINPAMLPKEHSLASINRLFQPKLAHAA